jgi:DNA polymerase III subunit delta'
VSDDDADNAEVLHPRETVELFGHADAERTLLESYQSGRIPHAWLIGGLAGIGKATLAYRMARFVLAHPDPGAKAVQKTETLAVDPDNPVARRIAVQSQGDLLVLQRTINDNTGKLYTVIRVEDVRRTISFFGSTAGEGGWRVCIVDTADELQYPQGSNALLKVLEEPPPRALFLLVSSSPGRLLTTIRSRCRRLALRPLDAEDVARAAASALGRKASDPEIKEASAAAEGSVGRALNLLDGSGLALRQKVLDLLAQLPQPDPRALHALGDALGGNEPRTLTAFMDIVNGWLSTRLADDAKEAPRMARLAQAWEKINRAARDTDTFNLERKPLVFAVFGVLAEAERR